MAAGIDEFLDTVLQRGERWEIPGRMNLSAGGTMVLEALGADSTAVGLARRAAKALGLRVEEAWRPAVRANLEVSLRLAKLVDDFPLPDETEAASVFSA